MCTLQASDLVDKLPQEEAAYLCFRVTINIATGLHDNPDQKTWQPPHRR